MHPQRILDKAQIFLVFYHTTQFQERTKQCIRMGHVRGHVVVNMVGHMVHKLVHKVGHVVGHVVDNMVGHTSVLE